MTRVVLLAATAAEAGLLAGAAGLDGRADVVVAGIGAVNTAHGLTRRLVTGPAPALVVQTGVAGAYVGAGVAVGSVVLATEEVYADVGVLTPDGWRSAEEIGIPLVQATTARAARFNHFPLDEALVRRAERASGERISRTGRFLTLSQVTGVRAQGDLLFERFGALCESMEGAAAAHVCALHDVPFLEVRGISNLVEDRNRATWRIREAAEAAQRVALGLVDQADALVAAEPAR